MRKSFVLASTLSFLSVVSLSAQNTQETQRFTFGLGAGFTTPVGNTGRFLDDGWNIQGGGGVNFSPYFGTMLNLNYNSMGVNSTTLGNLGFPGGGVHIFSATIDPIVHLNPHGRVDVYVTGGGGIYHDSQDFTTPGAATVTVSNGFFGAFPVGVPVTNVVSSYTVNKPGIDVGAGIALGNKWHGKFFAEARYNRIFMGQFHTDYVPVTFGFRW
jgi:hypothetical protein